VDFSVRKSFHVRGRGRCGRVGVRGKLIVRAGWTEQENLGSVAQAIAGVDRGLQIGGTGDDPVGGQQGIPSVSLFQDCLRHVSKNVSGRSIIDDGHCD
jgi:hypothetical protein